MLTHAFQRTAIVALDRPEGCSVLEPFSGKMLCGADCTFILLSVTSLSSAILAWQLKRWNDGRNSFLKFSVVKLVEDYMLYIMSSILEMKFYDVYKFENNQLNNPTMTE